MTPPLLWLWATGASVVMLLTSLPAGTAESVAGAVEPTPPAVTAPPQETVPPPAIAMPVEPLLPTPPTGAGTTGTTTTDVVPVVTPTTPTTPVPVPVPAPAPAPAPKQAAAPKPAKSPTTPPATARRYPNCDAARAAKAAPMRRGTPAYQAELDADKDGVACEGKGKASVPPPSSTPPAPPADPGTGVPPDTGTGSGTTAAARYGWGAPARADEFTSAALSGWKPYDGVGHAGKGRRSPDAFSVANGVLTVRGDAAGTTGGMAWDQSSKYGRWEGRVRAPVGNPSYNALLLLWPTAENFPVGGEIDFMEMTDPTRQSTNFFLHYGAANNQVTGKVVTNGTQWHNWAVEWSPKGVTAYLDGKPWYSTTRTDILPPGPMHLCIQLDWFPKGGATGNAQMQVDWVRYYPYPAR